MTRFVFCHHAERTGKNPGRESKNFPGITEKGETQTREKTKMLASTVKGMSDKSVLILGGCSKAVRTKSTLMVFTDELRQIFKDKKDVIFSKPFNPVTPLDALKEISMKSNDGRTKIIIDFPLHIEEFIALPGQKESAITRRMLTGLNGQVAFFRRFFPRNPMVLVNIGHASETDAFINYLCKRSGDEIAKIVSFM